MDNKIAKPDYDFKIKDYCGAEIMGLVHFASDIIIVKCLRGEANISINAVEYTIKKNIQFIILDTSFIRVLGCSDDFLIKTCSFSLNFFNEIFPILDNNIMNSIQNYTINIFTEENLKFVDLSFQQLCQLSELKDYTYRNALAINIVKNYLMSIYELTRGHVSSTDIPISKYKYHLLDSFFAICTEVDCINRNVEYYADKLCISTRYLHTIVKSALNKTPKQVIDYHISGKIKRLLLTTKLNNQQISDTLGFPDQATFRQFFKRNVGINPSKFRNQNTF